MELAWVIAGAVVFNAVSKLLDRHVMKTSSSHAYSWLTQVISTLLFLPLALSSFTFPTSTIAWMAVLISGMLWTCVSLSINQTWKNAEVSIKEPLSQSKLVWVLLFGVLFLGEAVTLSRVIGTLVVFLGMTLLIYHPERRWGRLTEPGVLWALGAAFLSASVAIADKFTLRYIPPETYGFLVYLLPAIFLTGSMRGRTQHLTELMRTRWKSAILSILLSTTSYYFTLQAYSKGDLTIVYPFLQLATILAVVASIVFFGEREHAKQKIGAVVLVVIGAIITKL